MPLKYFLDKWVCRRCGVSEQGFAGIVALCQAMSGPSRSQVSTALGLRRVEVAGALAAWCGLTLAMFGWRVKRYGQMRGPRAGFGTVAGCLLRGRLLRREPLQDAAHPHGVGHAGAALVTLAAGLSPGRRALR